MADVDLLCLANSRKLSGRCVAGLRLDGGGWVRLVSRLPHGVLSPRQTVLAGGGEVAGLDAFRARVGPPRPGPHQPENVEVATSIWGQLFGFTRRWRRLPRPTDDDTASILDAALVAGPELLHGTGDRVGHGAFSERDAVTSLALVKPGWVELVAHPDLRGRPRVRGTFALSSRTPKTYDLSVTDPIWEERVRSAGAVTLRNPGDRVLLTVSLGEEFNGFHYKILAAVVLVPESVPVTF